MKTLIDLPVELVSHIGLYLEEDDLARACRCHSILHQALDAWIYSTIKIQAKVRCHMMKTANERRASALLQAISRKSSRLSQIRHLCLEIVDRGSPRSSSDYLSTKSATGALFRYLIRSDLQLRSLSIQGYANSWPDIRELVRRFLSNGRNLQQLKDLTLEPGAMSDHHEHSALYHSMISRHIERQLLKSCDYLESPGARLHFNFEKDGPVRLPRTLVCQDLKINSVSKLSLQTTRLEMRCMYSPSELCSTLTHLPHLTLLSITWPGLVPGGTSDEVIDLESLNAALRTVKNTLRTLHLVVRVTTQDSNHIHRRRIQGHLESLRHCRHLRRVTLPIAFITCWTSRGHQRRSPISYAEFLPPRLRRLNCDYETIGSSRTLSRRLQDIKDLAAYTGAIYKVNRKRSRYELTWPNGVMEKSPTFYGDSTALSTVNRRQPKEKKQRM